MAQIPPLPKLSKEQPIDLEDLLKRSIKRIKLNKINKKVKK